MRREFRLFHNNTLVDLRPTCDCTLALHESPGREKEAMYEVLEGNQTALYGCEVTPRDSSRTFLAKKVHCETRSYSPLSDPSFQGVL